MNLGAVCQGWAAIGSGISSSQAAAEHSGANAMLASFGEIAAASKPAADWQPTLAGAIRVLTAQRASNGGRG